MAAPADRPLEHSDPSAKLSLAWSSQPRATQIRWGAFAAVLLLWVTVIAFASPASAVGVGAFSMTAPQPAAPQAVHGAPSWQLPATATHAPARAIASLAGSNPAGQAFVNGAELQNTLLQNRTNLFQNWSLAATDPVAAAAQLKAKLLGTPASAPAAAAPVSPVLSVNAGITVPTGSVTGTVEQWNSLTPLEGVAIQAYSASGASNCPIKTCAQVTSSSTGAFNVTAPVGADYVQFTLSYNLTNISYCEVYQGLTTNIGTIYLVPEAVLVGTVEANTSSHPKLPGVLVTAVSRDNTLVGVPTGASNSQGSFVAGLPPVPSVVTFSPPFGYEATFLFENATPAEHVSLGTVYIQKDPVVQLHFYNAVTGSAISGSCSAFGATQCNAITVCSAITPSNCGQQGVATGSSTVTAVGPAGNDFVKAWATGFVTDTVYIGYVAYNIGTFNAGNVYLTPLAAAQITSDITHNATTPLPHGWSEGMVFASSCSMSGLETAGIQINPSTETVNVTESGCTGGCGNPGSAFEIGSLPLRNDIKLIPDTNGNCAPAPTWPIPNFLPVWGNETWYNGTPNEVTTFFMNMSVGDYVGGNVSVSSGKVPSDFTVTPVAIDNTNFASYPYSETVATASGLGASPCKTVDRWLTGPGAFCVAVPPGASKLIVQTSLFPYEQNFTWGAAPNMCCSGSYPMTLSQYTTDHATTINLTALGSVTGHVAQAGTDRGVFFAAYSISAAGTSLNAPTFTGAVALNGTIESPAALGWDSVTVSASGYSPNTVWVNVSGNDSFGTVYLTPLATIAGRVVDPNGNGLLGANVYYCGVASTSSCTTPLGAGLASTDGGYNGTVPGLWLPYSSYEIYASSSGYTSDWTWVNTSAGQVTIAPTIVLYPATESATTVQNAAPRPASVNPLPQTYLTGYLIDNSTGEGLSTGGGNIQACSTATGACFAMLPGSNTQGLFNTSVPLGLYNLEVDAPGYLPSTLFVNASAGASQYLGVIELYPLPWVNGVATIDPFGEITVKKSSSVYVQIPEVPASTAMGCNANSSVCGASLSVSSNGSFTVQAPAGTYDKLQINAAGGATGPSTNGGFNSNDSTFNASANSTTILSTPLQLAIYVAIGGFVDNNNTTGPGGSNPWLFIPGAGVTVSTFGPSHATIAYNANLGGEYLAFVPPFSVPNLIVAGASMPGVFTQDQTSMTAALPETDPPAVVVMPTLGLEHYGWIQAQVLAANGTPAQFLAASATLNVGGSAGSEVGLGSTNAWGQLNLTAPPGKGVVLAVGPGNDYNTTTVVIDVNASATSIVGGGTLVDPGVLQAAHWGWAISSATNSSYAPVNTTILDLVHQLPIPDALVTVASSDTIYSGTGTDTNWQGQYVTDAPIGGLDTLAVTRSAALTNTTHLSVAAGQTRVQSVINLTGVGILAGEVVAYPSEAPVPGATVQTCPYSTGSQVLTSGCYSAETNASGDYWVPAYPGQVSIQTSAYGYVQNSSAVARSCSDCWNSIGPIVLSQFSYVTGSVRGLPSGLPLIGANVSVCSPVGSNPIGVCDFTVYTDINGNFVLEAPAGSYNLVANASQFNASIPLPVTLHPGQVLPIGTLFLEQFGSGQGAVLSDSTLLAIDNASVYPCASWSGGGCLPTLQTTDTGTFTLYGPPGTYTLTVSAPGYVVAYATVTLKAGVLSVLQPILMTPLGTSTYYSVSGEVVNASNPAQGLAGATVIAEINGTPAFTGTSSVNGEFSFTVLYGVYDLVATLPGFAPSNETIVAHNPISGLVFTLSVMTYLFTSSVTDGLTGSSLAGVAIAENSAILGVTDSSGFVSFPLSNGTHTLMASDPSSTAVSYASVTFAVSVAGAPVVHNLQLDPPSAVVHGVIVDAFSGVALSAVTVTIRGITVDGVPVTQSTTTNAQGGFSLTLTQGTYNASASVAGYTPRVVSFSVMPPGSGLNILLTPLSPTTVTHQAPSGDNVQLTLIALVGLVVVAAALGTLLLAMRRPPRSPSTAAPAKKAPQGGKR
jgi:hypothetical protein